MWPLHTKLLLLIVAICSVDSSSGVLKNHIKPEVVKNLQKYINSIVSSTQTQLKPPAILWPNTTSKEFIQDEYMDKARQVIAGIEVENYSKFRLVDPLSEHNYCRQTKEKCILESVAPGTFGMYMVDNQKSMDSSVCGTVSWQINHENGKPVVNEDNKKGRRLVVTYNVPFKGSCGPNGRHNSFSVAVREVIVNSTGHWQRPQKSKHFYSLYHKDTRDSEFTNQGHDHILGLFDKEWFLIRGSMERGCVPLLTIQFFAGPKFPGMTFNVKEEANQIPQSAGLSVNSVDTAVIGPSANKSRGSFITTKNIFMWTGIGAGILLVGLLLLTTCSVMAKKRRKRNSKNRRN